MPSRPRRPIPSALALAVGAVSAACTPGAAHAAHLSELFILDQPGPLPTVQGIELTGVDNAQGTTLALLNGSRFDTNGFGQVLDVIHLPAGGGWAPVVLIADQPWPDAGVPTTPLTDLDPAAGNATFDLGHAGLDRLLVVFDGATQLQVGDNPLNNADAAGRYDASAVTDWLAIGPSSPTDLATGYASSGLDIDGPTGVNATLGIDLLARTADRSAGEVIARTHAPGQLLDLDLAWIGDLDGDGRFPVGPDLVYRSTPGVANVPLIAIPEPGSASVLLGAYALLGLRRRRARC